MIMKDTPSMVVLVTGSSSGIGRACCERLMKSSQSVYGASRTVMLATRWQQLVMDVTDDASVQSAVDELLRRERRIDVLIHSAGFGLVGPFEETTTEEALGQLNTNYFGAIRTIRSILPVMRAQKSGKIIVIGSIGGYIGLPYMSHYSASKFALDGLVDALRLEIAPFGVQVMAVHPGDVNTSFAEHQVYAGRTTPNSPYDVSYRKAVAHYVASMRDACGADTIAAAVVNLAVQRYSLPPRLFVGSRVERGGVWLKALLPGAAFERVLRKALGQ